MKQDYRGIYNFIHACKPDYGASKIRVQLVAPFISKIQFKTVLDVGAGYCDVCDWIHKEYPEAKIAACDVSELSVIKIKKKYDWIDVKQADVCNLKYENKFDLVICTDVLEHLEKKDIPLAVENLKSATNEYILISTDDRFCEEDIYLKLAKIDMKSLHLTREGYDWWQKTLTLLGLEIIEKSYNDHKMVFLCRLGKETDDKKA
jgi:hypothetical protein